MLKLLPLLLTLGLLSTKSLAAFSDNPSTLPTEQTSTKLSISTATSTTPSKSLQGSVEKVELGFDKFQDIGLDLKTILRASTSLYEEVTRQPVRILTQPEMIGNGTFINLPVGTEPTGPPAPARKDRLDAAMKRMEPVIDTLKKDVDEFISGKKQLDLPPYLINRLQPQFQAWIKGVNSIAIKQRQLEQITYGPPYDNTTIAALASLISDNVKELDKIRLEIYKVTRKENKRQR